MRILVVCGAGASSTFVAMRLRHAAQARGVALQALAGAEASLSVDIDSADVVLVGPQISADLPRIEALAHDRGVRVIPLPENAIADLTGATALDVVLSSFPEAAVTSAPGTPSERDTKGTHHG